MTARPSSAGRPRTTARRCRACSTDAIAAFTGERVVVSGAGRTDAGVHALGQVAHVDLAKDWDGDTVRDAINCASAPAAGRGADRRARGAGLRRALLRRSSGITSIASSIAAPIWRSSRTAPGACRARSNAAAMHAAAQRLVGHHDFTTFRSAECQAKSPVKTLDRLDVARDGEEIRITASARSFLQHQVRSMVGSLVHVGEGKWSADDLAAALAARDRTACGQVAPPHGLYLVRVDY